MDSGYDASERRLNFVHRFSGDKHITRLPTCAQIGAVDKPYPIFKLRDKIEEKTGWDGYANTDRR